MKKILFILLFISYNDIALSSIKKNIINNLEDTNNLSFNFEQNINGKVETGNCIIEYPKKIFCKYDKPNTTSPMTYRLYHRAVNATGVVRTGENGAEEFMAVQEIRQ